MVSLFISEIFNFCINKILSVRNFLLHEFHHFHCMQVIDHYFVKNHPGTSTAQSYRPALMAFMSWVEARDQVSRDVSIDL